MFFRAAIAIGFVVFFLNSAFAKVELGNGLLNSQWVTFQERFEEHKINIAEALSVLGDAKFRLISLDKSFKCEALWFYFDESLDANSKYKVDFIGTDIKIKNVTFESSDSGHIISSVDTKIAHKVAMSLAEDSMVIVNIKKNNKTVKSIDFMIKGIEYARSSILNK